MMEESTPRTSAKWRAHQTFAEITNTTGEPMNKELVEEVKRKGSV